MQNAKEKVSARFSDKKVGWIGGVFGIDRWDSNGCKIRKSR